MVGASQPKQEKQLLIPEENEEKDLDPPVPQKRAGDDDAEVGEDVAVDDESEGDDAEVEDDAEVDSSDDDEDAALGDDEEEGDQTSLEDLIAQRAAGRKAAEEAGEEDDIMALASEPDEPVDETLPIRVAPISEQTEFVCKSCYLVKPRVQLADAERGYCRDCV